MRAYGDSIQAAASLSDDGVEVGQGCEVPIGDRLVHQGPQPLDCLSMMPLYAGFLWCSGRDAGWVFPFPISSSSAPVICTIQMC